METTGQWQFSCRTMSRAVCPAAAVFARHNQVKLSILALSQGIAETKSRSDIKSGLLEDIVPSLHDGLVI
jgi:hypothetical protein